MPATAATAPIAVKPSEARAIRSPRFNCPPIGFCVQGSADRRPLEYQGSSARNPFVRGTGDAARRLGSKGGGQNASHGGPAWARRATEPMLALPPAPQARPQWLPRLTVDALDNHDTVGDPCARCRPSGTRPPDAPVEFARHYAGTSAASMRSRTRRYECRHHSRPTVVAGVNIRRYAPNDGGSAQRSPVTFCDDHRTVFATASGRIQLTAGILAAAQAVLASLRAPHLDRSCGPAVIATAQGDGG